MLVLVSPANDTADISLDSHPLGYLDMLNTSRDSLREQML